MPKIVEMVRDRIPRRFGLDPLKDVQVLCPMNRGDLGARNLNLELQAVLNPNPRHRSSGSAGQFAPGDRIMETVNDYDREVFNGDLGTVARIDEEEGALIASLRWPGGELSVRRTRHARSRLRHDDPQEPRVGVPRRHHPGRDPALHDARQEPALHGRDPRQALVVLVGQKRAVAIAVRGGQTKRRWTKLREWLT